MGTVRVTGTCLPVVAVSILSVAQAPACLLRLFLTCAHSFIGGHFMSSIQVDDVTLFFKDAICRINSGEILVLCNRLICSILEPGTVRTNEVGPLLAQMCC